MELTKQKLFNVIQVGLVTGLLVSLFFPIRLLIPSSLSFLTSQFSDFTAVWLYLSDIFIFLLLISGIISKNIEFSRKSLIIFAIFSGMLSVTAYLSGFQPIYWYWILKLIEFSLVYIIFSNFSLKYEEYITFFSKFFVLLALFQVFLAILQHYFGHSMGLYWLGESHLSTARYQVAKIVAHGTTYLRGYGTFPHPNLLSAYLLTAVLVNIYILHHVVGNKLAYIWRFSLILIIIGLFTTFSRAGLLAMLVSLILIGIYWTWSKTNKKEILSISLPIFFGFLISVALFYQFLSPRGEIYGESLTERVVFNEIALKMIQNYPLSGVGLGESMLHMEQYSAVKLEPWQIQPIHNYFLLATTEGGIPFGLALLSIFCYFLIKLGHSIWNNPKDDRVFIKLILFALLIGYLLLMQIDHYFYTLQQTQLLLWIVLGLIAAEFKRTAVL
jgi:hypothetical protein